MKKLYTLTFALLLFQAGFFAQDGSLDATFGNAGIATLAPGNFQDVVYDLAVQTDDKIVFAGVSRISTTIGNSLDLVVGRLESNGSIDASFANNGIYNLASTVGSVFGYDLKLQSDGKIVVCGGYAVTESDMDFMVLRLNDDGTPDVTFGDGNGLSIIPVNGGEDYAYELELLADGKILLTGTSAVPGFSYSSGIVMRLMPDGTIDSTFGTGGLTSLQLNENSADNFYRLEVLPSGKIITTGYSYFDDVDHLLLAGFNADGSVDATFATNGIHTGISISTAFDLVTDGNVVYVGGRVSNSGGFDLGITCFDTSGNIQTSFGDNGTVMANYNPLDCILGMHIQSDGKLLCAGTSGLGGFGNRDMLVTRYLPSGLIDPTFASTGYSIIPVTSNFEEASTITQQNDGKILLAGFASFIDNDMVFIRLNNELASGIEAVEFSNSLGVYPVPVNGTSLWISSPTGFAGAVTCELIDLMGRQITCTHFLHYVKTIELLLPEYLASGKYILRVQSEGFYRSCPIVK